MLLKPLQMSSPYMFSLLWIGKCVPHSVLLSKKISADSLCLFYRGWLFFLEFIWGTIQMKYALDIFRWIRNMSPYGESQNGNTPSSVWKETFIPTDLPFWITRGLYNILKPLKRPVSEPAESVTRSVGCWILSTSHSHHSTHPIGVISL